MSCESHWEEKVSLVDGNKWRPIQTYIKKPKGSLTKQEPNRAQKKMIYTKKQKDQGKKSFHYLWLRVSQETKISEQNFNVNSKYHIPTAAISFFSLLKTEIIINNINLNQNDQKLKMEYSKQNQSDTLKK